MRFSPLEITVVLALPVILTIILWSFCRRQFPIGGMILAFIGGAFSVLPVIRLTTLVAGHTAESTGHYYLHALLQEFVATALPEELGKNLAAATVLLLFARTRPAIATSPLAWLAVVTASHAGFAAVEGLLGSLANEGILKVVVGRSLGTISHVAWGLTCGWFACQAWSHSGSLIHRTLLLFLAFLTPISLHAITNASVIAVPGDTISVVPGGGTPTESIPSTAEMLIVLSGMAALVASVAIAVLCLCKARRYNKPSPSNLLVPVNRAPIAALS